MGPQPITGIDWKHPKCHKCGAELLFRYSISEVFMIATMFLLAGAFFGYFLHLR